MSTNADRIVVAHAGRTLGLRAGVRLRELTLREMRRWHREHGGDLHGLYDGRDPDGTHVVAIAPRRRGVGRIYSLAHEMVHAAQCEQHGGSFRRFTQAYALAQSLLGYWANPYEEQARELGRSIAAALAQCDIMDLEIGENE